MKLPIDSTVENLYGMLLASMIGYASSAVVMALIAYPTANVLIWLLTFGFVVGLRVFDHRQFRKMSAKRRKRDADKLLRRFVILAFITGALVMVFTTHGRCQWVCIIAKLNTTAINDCGRHGPGPTDLSSCKN